MPSAGWQAGCSSPCRRAAGQSRARLPRSSRPPANRGPRGRPPSPPGPPTPPTRGAGPPSRTPPRRRRRTHQQLRRGRDAGADGAAQRHGGLVGKAHGVGRRLALDAALLVQLGDLLRWGWGRRVLGVGLFAQAWPADVGWRWRVHLVQSVRAHTHTHTTLTHTHTCTHTHIHTHTHAHTHTHTHTRVHIHTHTHTRAHARTRTHAHTHTHTHTTHTRAQPHGSPDCFSLCQHATTRGTKPPNLPQHSDVLSPHAAQPEAPHAQKHNPKGHPGPLTSAGHSASLKLWSFPQSGGGQRAANAPQPPLRSRHVLVVGQHASVSVQPVPGP
jgi:hypothetical protein